MKAWLKGGLIGFVIFLVLGLFIFGRNVIFRGGMNEMGTVIALVYLIPAIIIGFIIGALIGLIISKLKK